jgi:hypothetical protein
MTEAIEHRENNPVEQTLTFFATAGPVSAAGEHAYLLEDLPHEVGALCRTVQGLMVHLFWAQRYGLQPSPQRQAEVQLRTTAAKLARIRDLDPRPLEEARALDKRLVGNCRDFSLMLAAILRYQGVPARARCGFGRYFLPHRYEDHWVCEYWNTSRGAWQLVDAQLDKLQCDTLKVAFDPLDVPRDQFVSGGEAWHLCRSGHADPDAFGIQHMHGLWFVRGDLVRDVASLNKVELLPWDAWGLIEGRDEDMSPEDMALLDQAAQLTSADVPDWPVLRQLYDGEARLRVPGTILSHGQGGPQVVELHGMERA